MQIVEEKRGEMPWAVEKKPGFQGEAPGLYFHYFRTCDEAKKAARWMKRNKQWCGKVEFRPGECYRLGTVLF